MFGQVLGKILQTVRHLKLLNRYYLAANAFDDNDVAYFVKLEKESYLGKTSFSYT